MPSELFFCTKILKQCDLFYLKEYTFMTNKKWILDLSNFGFLRKMAFDFLKFNFTLNNAFKKLKKLFSALKINFLQLFIIYIFLFTITLKRYLSIYTHICIYIYTATHIIIPMYNSVISWILSFRPNYISLSI